MIDLKAWVIHALGGVTAEEQERGLRLARPIKHMLADMNESLYKLGHYHQSDREAASSVWIDLTRQVPFPQQAPDSAPLTNWSEMASKAFAPYPQHVPKEDTGLMRVTGVGHLPITRKTGDLARLAAIKQAERRQG